MGDPACRTITAFPPTDATAAAATAEKNDSDADDDGL